MMELQPHSRILLTNRRHSRIPKPIITLVTLVILVLIGTSDYLTGTEYSFLLFYFIPVAIVSWYIGRRAGYAVALSATIVWTIVDYFGRPSLTLWLATWNIVIQFILFIVFAYVISQIREIVSEYQRLNDELQDALGEVKRLSGFLPVCSWCKRIRDEHGQWHQMEVYIAQHSEADFSHGICPDCAKKNFEKEPPPTSRG
jgi:K+-sensing histidine kinase KdpD